MEIKSSVILLVDDSEMSNTIFCNLLNRHGFHNLVITTSAEMALTYLNLPSESVTALIKSVQLIITDFIMPGMNGLEFAKIVKSSDAYKDIPMVMISASYNERILQEAFRLGIIDYIAKPYNNDFFLGRIRSILNVHTKLTDLQRRELLLENANQKMVDDLTIAKKLQTQLLPTGLSNQHISIHGIYLPFEFLGGDFYYWQQISPGMYGIVLLDVMGHGTATSLICMYLRSLLPELMRSSSTPEILIQLLNQYLIDFNAQLTMPYHCTAFYMMINTINHQIKYVNAGHPYVAYFDEHQEVHWLEDGCIPLGIFDRLKIHTGSLNFSPLGQLFLYSDGIYELLKQNSLDINYMLNYIRIYGNMSLGSQGILDKLFSLIEQIDRNDDVSLVYIEFPKLKGEQNEGLPLFL